MELLREESQTRPSLINRSQNKRSTGSDVRLLAAKLTILGPLIAVAGGRWGTYLGVPGTPVYFTDLAVAAGLVLFFVANADHSVRKTRPPTRLPTPLRAAALFIAVALAIGVFSTPQLTILSIRDSVPFLYLLLIPVFYRSVELIGRKRALRWLRNAALLHGLWFVPAMFKILPAITIPLVGGVPAFSTRGDFDVLICGLTLVVIVMDRSLPKPIQLVLSVATAASALLSGSRAGLIAAIVVVVCVGLLQRPFSDRQYGLRRLGVAVLAFVPTVVVLMALSQNPPSWAIGLQKLLPNDSSVYQSGQNTWEARINAWTLLSRYTIEHGKAMWTGFGFGGSQVLDSGAVRYLSGDPAVRAAHNFVVTWFAVVGLVGVALILVALTLWLVSAVVQANRLRGVNSMGLGLAVGVVLAAFGGVILESPFGYLTFALAIAYAVQPTGQPIGPGSDDSDPAP